MVYVDFWASWCTPCRASFPLSTPLYRENASRGPIVGMNKDSSVDDAQKFMKKLPVTFPLVPDPQDAAAKAFDVKTMPSGLVDRKGVVRKVHRGFTTGDGGRTSHRDRGLAEGTVMKRHAWLIASAAWCWRLRQCRALPARYSRGNPWRWIRVPATRVPREDLWSEGSGELRRLRGRRRLWL